MTDDRPDTHKGLRAIALFEAAKGVFALIVSGALAAIGPDALQHQFERVLTRFGVDAERSGELLYVATLPLTPEGRWRLTVSDNSQEWRLRANLTLPAEQEIKLGY